MKRTTNRDMEPPVCTPSAKNRSIQYHAVANMVLTGIKTYVVLRNARPPFREAIT